MAKYRPVVNYCSEHGPFIGLRWNGHRIRCRAPKTTKKDYKASAQLRPQEKLSGMRAQLVLKIDPAKFKKVVLPGEMDDCVETLSQKMTSLNMRIEELKHEIDDREKEIFRLTQLRSSLKQSVQGLLDKGN